MRIVIEDLPPTLNDVINMSKRHWSLYSNMKAQWKELVRLSSLRAKKIEGPVRIVYTFVLPNNRRRDLDNFYIKGINDGLWFLPDDNCAIIQEITLKYKVEKNIKRTIIEIEEICPHHLGPMDGAAYAKNAKRGEPTSANIMPSTEKEYSGKIENGRELIRTKSPRPSTKRISYARKVSSRNTVKTSGSR